MTPGDPTPLDELPWLALVAGTRALLRQVACDGGTITYAQLRARLDVALPRRGGQDLAALLRAVSIAEEREGRGLLSAVVVGPSGRPGSGWFRLAADAGRYMADRDAAWQGERERLRDALPPSG